MRPGELVVHCSVRDGEGGTVELLLRAPAGAPASAVLAIVLRRALDERRRGRILTVEGPPEVVALLAACGLDSGGLRP